MARFASKIELTTGQRLQIEALAKRRRTSQCLALRARIVLAAAQGLEKREICQRLGVAPNTVGKWRRRYAEFGLDGLFDEPRPGAPLIAFGMEPCP